MYVCMYVCMHIYIYIYIYSCLYIRTIYIYGIYAYTIYHIYIYIYIYIYKCIFGGASLGKWDELGGRCIFLEVPAGSRASENDRVAGVSVGFRVLSGIKRLQGCAADYEGPQRFVSDSGHDRAHDSSIAFV